MPLLPTYWFSNPYKMYLPPPRHIPEKKNDLSSLLIVVYLAATTTAPPTSRSFLDFSRSLGCFVVLLLIEPFK